MSTNKFSLRSYLLELIESSNLEKAFEVLDRYYAAHPNAENIELGTIRSRFNRIQKDFRLGRFSPNEFAPNINRVVHDFHSWVKAYIEQDETWYDPEIIGEEGYDLSIIDLRDQLHEILEFNGLEPLLFFLGALVSSTKLKHELSQLKEAYEFFEWKQNKHRTGSSIFDNQSESGKSITDTLKEEEQFRKNEETERRRFRERTQELIDSINEDHLFINWRIKYLEIKTNFKHKERNRPKRTLISPLDIIEIPDYLDQSKDYKDYKRMMIRAQDAYIAEEYDEAYNLCVQVRNEVDPESAQLYEYLFITYFHKIGVNEIIDQALDNRKGDKHLKLLFLYASRFERLQSIVSSQEADDPKNPWGANKIAYRRKNIRSSTGDFNIKEITNELLLTLADRYTRIAEKKKNLVFALTPAEKDKVRMCLNIARSITEHIKVDAVFASTVINELAGGGKHQWVAIDKLGELVNTEADFDALNHFENAVRLLSYERGITEQKIEEKLATDLLNTLTAKYNKLKSVVAEAIKEEEKRLLLTKLLVSFRVASELFPRQRETFAKTPLEELRNKSSILEWYELYFKRQLIPLASKEFPNYFDAKEFHKYFLTGDSQLNSFSKEWEAEEEALIEVYYHKLVSAMEKQQSEIISQRFKINPLAPRLDFLNAVVSCYRKWQICFDVRGETVYLQKAFDELVGNNAFFWYELDLGGFQNLPVCKDLNQPFDPVHEIRELVEKRMFTSYEVIDRSRALNYFNRFLRLRIKVIRSRVKGNPNPSFEYRKDLLDCFKEIIRLCKVAGPQAEFGNLLYDELVAEDTIPWIDVKNGKLIPFNQKGNIVLDPIIVLKRASFVFSDFQKFSAKNVYRKIVANRMEKIKESYEYDFSLHRLNNDHPDEIERMVRIIYKLIGFYKLTKDKKCLEIPYKELVEGKGRIYWAKNKWVVKRLWPPKLGRVRLKPRWLIRMVSDFDYNRIRWYVKTEYEQSEHSLAYPSSPAETKSLV